MNDNIKMELSSRDVASDRLEQFKLLFPEVITEGKVDFERLKEALGKDFIAGAEYYGFSWAGKSEAIKNIQTSSVGTLLPVQNQSVNFDNTENMIIEGDNLEVLKLLQKSYHGKVKMIYIDPPYNTGNEFIYPDNFREGLDDYLRYTGQVDNEGVKLTTNTESDGRFHSKWLTMMYPRLFLARNLLRDDGLIFVSIDDHEVHNLRIIMNETFGEENFVAELVWQKKTGAGARSKGFIGLHEYILCYARNITPEWDMTAPMSEKTKAMYNKQDEHFPKLGPYATWPLDTTSMDERANLRFPIFHADQEIWPRKQWLWSRERVEKAQKENKLVFNYNDKEGTWSVRFKGYLYDNDGEEKSGKPTSMFIGPYTQEGTKNFEQYFERDVFPFPKPVALIKQLLSISVNDQDPKEGIILDFFAGSGTTAQAVLDLNSQDGGNRKFILVQLPEQTDREEYPTIAEITKERVRRVIDKLRADDENKLNFNSESQDWGFKMFKLSSSNFKVWDGMKVAEKPEEITDQLLMFANNVRGDRTHLDMLYEVVLKAGLPFTVPIHKKILAEQEFYSVAEGLLLVCLEETVTSETVHHITELHPKQVVCLDVAFHGNDMLKTNTVLEMKSHGISFKTV